MKYYTYDNPNLDSGRTDWGTGVDGSQLESLCQDKCLEMRDDADNPPEIPSAGDVILGGGHARCTDDTLITHPGFTEVAEGSADGTDYWDACKALDDALRVLDDVRPESTY